MTQADIQCTRRVSTEGPKRAACISSDEGQWRDRVSMHSGNNILIGGGDQFTLARIRGFQRVLSNSHSGEECLERLISVEGRVLTLSLVNSLVVDRYCNDHASV